MFEVEVASVLSVPAELGSTRALADVLVGEKVACHLRGRFRQEEEGVLVGDRVEASVEAGGGSLNGMIERRLPRTVVLERPPVANVDQVAVIVTMRRPPYNGLLLDRHLLAVERASLAAIIVCNKIDVIEDDEWQSELRCYRDMGYPVLGVSARDGLGLNRLRSHLQDRLTVFTGESGVGKSSLLNALKPGLGLNTGKVSQRNQRGRHTTRQAEIVNAGGRVHVVDTPGFQRLDLSDIAKEDFVLYWRDMREVAAGCRFSPCFHINEPGCAVKQAVERGEIDEQRYEHYLSLWDEIEEWEANRY